MNIVKISLGLFVTFFCFYKVEPMLKGDVPQENVPILQQKLKVAQDGDFFISLNGAHDFCLVKNVD